jgi:hypothetical protein
MSKDLFLMMREAEVATSNFLPTKKELQKSSKEFAKQLLDSGDYNIEELYSQALRMKEAIEIIESELKSSLPIDGFEAFGIKAIFRNGGDTINYKDDKTWSDIKKQLTDRESLLKHALKSNEIVYDGEGVEVPKISTTPRKSSIAVSF